MTQSRIYNQTLLNLILLAHLIIIALSNYLVQYPLVIGSIDTTLGAFSFPLIFVLTDLTVRIYGAAAARKIIFTALIPALILSYAISVLFYQGQFTGVDSLGTFNVFVARIALASFIAYGVGQLMDISIFNRLRTQDKWWLAPAVSTTIGSLIDTFIFFFIAFYQSTDEFMAANWQEIAWVDYATKLTVALLMFLPLYKLLLNRLKQAAVN